MKHEVGCCWAGRQSVELRFLREMTLLGAKGLHFRHFSFRPWMGMQIWKSWGRTWDSLCFPRSWGGRVFTPHHTNVLVIKHQPVRPSPLLWISFSGDSWRMPFQSTKRVWIPKWLLTWAWIDGESWTWMQHVETFEKNGSIVRKAKRRCGFALAPLCWDWELGCYFRHEKQCRFNVISCRGQVPRSSSAILASSHMHCWSVLSLLFYASFPFSAETFSSDDTRD